MMSAKAYLELEAWAKKAFQVIRRKDVRDRNHALPLVPAEVEAAMLVDEGRKLGLE